jgi:hypothetical protein
MKVDSRSVASSVSEYGVVRGSYGIFYDVRALSIFYTAAQVNGNRFLSYQIAGSDPQAPVFPNVRNLQVEFHVAPNINAFAPRYYNTYQHQANFQIQREVTNNLLVTIGYNVAAPRHGLYSQNINLGARKLSRRRPSRLRAKSDWGPQALSAVVELGDVAKAMKLPFPVFITAQPSRPTLRRGTDYTGKRPE